MPSIARRCSPRPRLVTLSSHSRPRSDTRADRVRATVIDVLAWKTTKVGALGIAALFALVFVPSSWAWAWPADGAVLAGYSVGGNPYAGGQHRGIDVAVVN